MGLLAFLSKNNFDPQAFEKELSQISSKIATNERNLNKFTNNVNRTKKFILRNGLLIYLSGVAYMLLNMRFDFSRLDLTKEIIFIVAFPVLLLLINRVVLVKLFNFRKNKYELELESLKLKHEEKIEELKQKTNFQSTRSLLERFSDGHDINEEIELKKKELEELNRLSAAMAADQEKGKGQQGSTNKKKNVLDFMVNSFIGSDDELSSGHRFALICQNCHNHNGLAPPGKVSIKYRCPVCGFFNDDCQPGEKEALKSKPEGANVAEQRESEGGIKVGKQDGHKESKQVDNKENIDTMN